MKLNEIFKKDRIEDQSKWCEYNGAKFLVAPMGNRKQREVTMETFTLSEAVEMDRLGPLAFGGLTAKEAVSKMYRLYATTLVLDNDGIEDEEGNPIKLSTEQIFGLMMDHDEFANWVIKESQDIAEGLSAKANDIKKK
jgi:hypothetical protein